MCDSLWNLCIEGECLGRVPIPSSYSPLGRERVECGVYLSSRENSSIMLELALRGSRIEYSDPLLIGPARGPELDLSRTHLTPAVCDEKEVI